MIDTDPFKPGRPISGFKTGALGMGHAVVHVKKIDDLIPFYKDFLKLDNLLEKDSQLLVIGTRINTFHSPRKIYHYQKSVSIPNYGIKTKDKPTYLFLVGYKKDISQNFGQLIHSNENANQFCYRVPKKLCSKNRLEVYKINNFTIYFK